MVLGSRSGRVGARIRSPHSRSTSAVRLSVAAVEKHRADQRLADVGEDRGARAPSRVGLRGAEPQRLAEIDGARHVGAGFAPHQVGEPARQLAFVALGEGAKQHFRDDQAENVVAEKLEPLIAAGAAAAGQSRDVGQRAHQQIAVLEAIADGLLKRAGGRGARAGRIGVALGRRALRRGLGGWRRSGNVRVGALRR